MIGRMFFFNSLVFISFNGIVLDTHSTFTDFLSILPSSWKKKVFNLRIVVISTNRYPTDSMWNDKITKAPLIQEQKCTFRTMKRTLTKEIFRFCVNVLSHSLIPWEHKNQVKSIFHEANINFSKKNYNQNQKHSENLYNVVFKFNQKKSVQIVFLIRIIYCFCKRKYCHNL